MEVLDTLVVLTTAEPGGCDREGLAVLAAASHRVQAWLAAFDVRVARRAAELAAAGQAEAPAELLACGKRAQRETQRLEHRAATCAAVPALAEALERGDVSAAHVDAVTRTTATLDDAGRVRLATHGGVLAEAAAQMRPEDFERTCRGLARQIAADEGVGHSERLRSQRHVRRWVDGRTGMANTLLSLDPLADARVWAAFHGAIGAARAGGQDDGLTWDQLQADAVVALITGAGAAGETVPEVCVLIDAATLAGGLHAQSVCETSAGAELPPETVRRLGCDGDVVPVLFAWRGGVCVLDVGRASRLATRPQRQALRALYRTCAHPHCTVAVDACRIHHVQPWQLGGRTDLGNLVPLCERHHHAVHEGRWRLELRSDRSIEWRRPDGAVYFDGPTADRLSRPTGTPPASGDADRLSDAVEAQLARFYTAGTGPARPP